MILVELDDREARAALAEAEARAAHARALLSRLRTVDLTEAMLTLERSEAELAVAEANRARTASLVADRVAPRADLESAELTVARASAARDTASVLLRSLRPAGSEARGAVATVSEAEAGLAAARLRLDQHQIRAPADGVVMERLVEIGDVVGPQQVLLVVTSDGPYRVSVEPDERALGLVRVGAPARASAEAFPDHPFDTHVSWISPEVDESRGTVEVRLEIQDAPSYLRPGMTLSVHIVAEVRPHALVVPREAVRDAETAPWLLVYEAGGRARRADVELGLSTAEHTEIVSGVPAGSRIALPEAVGATPPRIHPWD